MNVYHISYGPSFKNIHLHFWGCNLNCRSCLLKREIYDCHLAETKDRILLGYSQINQTPDKFLEIKDVMQLLRRLEVSEVILMGAEPSLDPELPQLTELLHKEFSCRNILLTNGFSIPDLTHIDEVVFSIKAYNDSIHRDYTGKSNKKALKNFIKVYKSGVKLRTESIYIPEYIESAETEKIAGFIASVDKDIPYRIDAYIPIGDTPWRKPETWEIEHAAITARKHLTDVSYLHGRVPLKYEVIRVF